MHHIDWQLQLAPVCLKIADTLQRLHEHGHKLPYSTFANNVQSNTVRPSAASRHGQQSSCTCCCLWHFPHLEQLIACLCAQVALEHQRVIPEALDLHTQRHTLVLLETSNGLAGTEHDIANTAKQASRICYGHQSPSKRPSPGP